MPRATHPPIFPILADALPRLSPSPAMSWGEAGRRFLDHPAGRASAVDGCGWRERDVTGNFEGLFAHMDTAALEAVFSFDELVYLSLNCFISDNFWRDLETVTHSPRFLVYKVQRAMARAWGSPEYTELKVALDGIGRLLETDLGPAFELRLTWTHWDQRYSYSCHGDALGKELYLDAPLGLLLFHRGVHVLTVGFNPTPDGCSIAQVQLRQKKGNRWLFSVPGGVHFLDWVLGWFAAAWAGGSLYLATGSSCVEAIRKEAGKAYTLEEEAATRIRALYDRPLAGYERGAETVRDYGRHYLRLTPRPAQEKVSDEEPTRTVHAPDGSGAAAPPVLRQPAARIPGTRQPRGGTRPVGAVPVGGGGGASPPRSGPPHHRRAQLHPPGALHA